MVFNKKLDFLCYPAAIWYTKQVHSSHPLQSAKIWSPTIVQNTIHQHVTPILFPVPDEYIQPQYHSNNTEYHANQFHIKYRIPGKRYFMVWSGVVFEGKSTNP